MKNLFIALFFISSSVCAQCKLDGTSPFTAVKWDGELPQIRIDDQWITPTRFDQTSVAEIISYCKKEYQTDWKKRFSEDFVEVLCGMGAEPSKVAKISWYSGEEFVMIKASFSKKNRKKVLAFNDENPEQLSVKSPKFLSSSQAIADVLQFGKILRTRSSYLQVGSQTFEVDTENLIAELGNQDSIKTSVLSRELGIILGKIGDRHSSIRSDQLRSDSERFLPFAVAPLNGNKIVALKPNGEEYVLFFEDFPLLTKINQRPIAEILALSDYEEIRAPAIARHTRMVSNLSDLAFVFQQNGLNLPDTVEFTFSDTSGQKTKSILMPLSPEEFTWVDVGSCSANYYPLMRDKKYEALFKVVGNTGYIAIPRMTDSDRDPEFFSLLKVKMEEMKDTKALVLDIRHNGGGVRDLLRLLAPYFMNPESPSWVANLAKIRVDTVLTSDFDGATTRGLFAYNSPQFTDADREAIDVFMESFEAKVPFEKEKFSDLFYMLLSSKNSDDKYYYDKPVYVLMDERSFSAASVFAAAFKGLNNVKIVGVRSDGSSGMSKRYVLGNSWATLRLSRMISFQRDGLPLDGFGTEPDIILERDFDQILGKRDTQLESLLEMIESN